MRPSTLAIVFMIVWASEVLAETKILMLTNHSGHTVTTVAATDRNNPEATIAVTLEAAISNNETAFVALDLPEGTCLADFTYTLSSSEVTTQNDLDVCNLDGLVVE